MKIIRNILILAFLFNLNNQIFSQSETSKNEDTVQLRSFIKENNVLKVKNETFIGKIKGKKSVEIRFYTVDYYPFNDNLKHVKGIKVTIEEDKKDNKFHLSAYIDYDQFTNIDSFLVNMSTETRNWKEAKNSLSEISFITKDNFELKILQNDRKQSGLAIIKQDRKKISCSFGSGKKNLQRIIDIFNEADEVFNPSIIE